MRAEIVAAARSCVGARFRPQGRDPTWGLDCVGVAAIAYGARLRAPMPLAYAQRGGSEEAIRATAARMGLRAIMPKDAGPGDLLLLLVGPAQWHLAVLTETGFVHADAGVRRVTEVPGLPRWPVTCAWTMDGER